MADPTDLAEGQWLSHKGVRWPEIPDGSQLQIWAYSGQPSYAPGDVAEFHVSTTAAHFNLTIIRDGISPTVLTKVGPVPGVWHPTPPAASSAGCNWPVSVALRIPDSWQPGGYIVVASAEDSRGVVSQDAFFALRGLPAKRSPIALVLSTYTWNAYNDWGGANSYSADPSVSDRGFATRLSLQRPWARGLIRAPKGAPRFGSQPPPAIGGAIRHEWSEWAYAHGYTRYAACAGWAKFDGLMARWLEADGWQFDLVTQWDLDRDPEVLSGRDAVVTCGHDEYWSGQGRGRLRDFIEGGGNHARFGGNIMWQVRANWKEQYTECFKFDMHEDPRIDGPIEVRTGAFEGLGIAQPPVTEFGANGGRGIYSGWGGHAPRGVRGFIVYRPQHWAFAGTDCYYGDVLGETTSLVSYEADGLDYTFRDGLPYPTGADGAPAELTILALTPVTLEEEDHGNPGSQFETLDHDLRGIARLLFGEDSPESRDRCRYGSAVMTSMQRGRGEVFCAGTTEWANSLTLGDEACATITRNVLGRFLRRAD